MCIYFRKVGTLFANLLNIYIFNSPSVWKFFVPATSVFTNEFLTFCPFSKWWTVFYNWQKMALTVQCAGNHRMMKGSTGGLETKLFLFYWEFSDLARSHEIFRESVNFHSWFLFFTPPCGKPGWTTEHVSISLQPAQPQEPLENPRTAGSSCMVLL